MEKLEMNGIEGIESDGREKSEGEVGPVGAESALMVAPSRAGGCEGPESSPIRLSQLMGGCESPLSNDLAFVEGDQLAVEEGGLLSVVGPLAVGVAWLSLSSSSEDRLARLDRSLPARIGLLGGWTGEEGETRIEGTPV